MSIVTQGTHELLRRLPKAELHVHIEGTLEPDLMFDLAGRHGIRLPYESVTEVRRAYVFDDLQSFLDLYYQGCAVLRTADDFRALGAAYFARAAAAGVRHAEVFFDPQTHTERGLALVDVVQGLTQAAADALTEHGISVRLIPCFLRHLSAQSADATLDQLLALEVPFEAVGLDSSERGHPPRKFADVFARARAAGIRAVAHAGEEGPPEFIWEALDILQVIRVDHGVRCLEDDRLVRRLAESAVPLTVCPLSNVRLRVVDHMAAHPLAAMLRRGLRVTVNSDDPAYFGGYIDDNFVALHEETSLSVGELAEVARNSFRASLLSAAEQDVHIRAIDDVLAAASIASTGESG